MWLVKLRRIAELRVAEGNFVKRRHPAALDIPETDAKRAQAWRCSLATSQHDMTLHGATTGQLSAMSKTALKEQYIFMRKVWNE